MFYETIYPSPLGPLTLVSNGQALVHLSMETQAPFPGKTVHSSGLPLWKEVFGCLDCYFGGGVPGPLPLAPEGTDFQKRVWALLMTIPYGETTTYGDLARAVGPRMSPQAVGRAVGKNPISILIPCHRVIGRNGSLTGYSGGLENKKFLLALEGSLPESI